jgi:hypothetical protein
MRLRGEATIHYCATRSHSPPPGSPNRPLPPKPLIGHALASLCPHSTMPGDAKTGVCVPAHTHNHSPHSTHACARHRAPDAMHPTPCTLAHPAHRTAHRFTRSCSETMTVLTKPPSQFLPSTSPLEPVHNAASERRPRCPIVSTPGAPWT